jgi:hypothetical protein
MTKLGACTLALVTVVAMACGKKDSSGSAASSDKAGADRGAAPGAGDFKDYQHKSKATEAKLYLHMLEKEAKTTVVENSALPSGSATDPEKPCCTSADHKCPPSAAPTADSVFDKLGFRREDPGYFQYHYESDGKTATATATGDLDCDGHPTTFTLHLAVDAKGDVTATYDPAQ